MLLRELSRHCEGVLPRSSCDDQAIFQRAVKALSGGRVAWLVRGLSGDSLKGAKRLP